MEGARRSALAWLLAAGCDTLREAIVEAIDWQNIPETTSPALYHRMKEEILRLAPETPVEIVAHEMVTQKCERAYIVEEKKLIGVVYRKDIVRKVLNL